MTNLPEATLREQLDQALSESNCNYVENQLWKEGAITECLSSAIKRKTKRHYLELAGLESIVMFLAFLLLLDSSIFSMKTLSAAVIIWLISSILLEYFLRSREKLTKLQLLSKLWNELAETKDVAGPDESHTPRTDGTGEE